MPATSAKVTRVSLSTYTFALLRPMAIRPPPAQPAPMRRNRNPHRRQEEDQRQGPRRQVGQPDAGDATGERNLVRFQLLDQLRILDAHGAKVEVWLRTMRLNWLICSALRIPSTSSEVSFPETYVGADHHVGDLAGIDELLELRVGDLARPAPEQVGVQQDDQRHCCDEVPERESESLFHDASAALGYGTHSTGQGQARKTFSAVLPKSSSSSARAGAVAAHQEEVHVEILGDLDDLDEGHAFHDHGIERVGAFLLRQPPNSSSARARSLRDDVLPCAEPSGLRARGELGVDDVQGGDLTAAGTTPAPARAHGRRSARSLAPPAVPGGELCAFDAAHLAPPHREVACTRRTA